ncbi:helix-turn-helix transcriptional regulator [Actinoplanes aureus]|uniref:helix-turn-helix transcriptional regulator n=1 Tax=Actinoplanes aureus TaxID=2792083 RepID=UPI002815310D|nr:AraC family transcriptional regulator [Actinoplanes aureus]
MLSSAVLAARPEFTVAAVTCREDHRGWSAAESHDRFRVVIVRRGRFRRQTGGVRADLDPTVAYLGVPGEVERFAHPAGGDICTSVTVTPALWRSMAGDRQPVRPIVYVDGAVDLAHRRVLVAARTGDVDFALAERLLTLIGHAITQAVAKPVPSARSGDRPLVGAAREAIGTGHPASGALLPLAALLGVSPYRLSRAFTAELGVSLTRYRNRVRVARALDRLEAGETRLAMLAADLGFADQAHLCRTVRAHVGHTPTALRRLLTRTVEPGVASHP